MSDPITELTKQHNDISSPATRKWAEGVIMEAVRDTKGALKPSALFDGLSPESAELFARAFTTLTDKQIISTYADVAEDGTVEMLIGFSVAANR